MMRNYLSLLALSLAILGSATGCGSEQSKSTPATASTATPQKPEATPTPAPPATEAPKLSETANQKVKYAILTTNLGTIKLELFPDQAPKTVDNFVQLAEGTKAWKLPGGSAMAKRPYYDGLIFHRVIPGFMIQSGCPLGTGTGDPGYEFEDEFAPGLEFSKPGVLAMANRGPHTNGSQFFITVAPTPHLSGRHTIFGHVVEGQDVADKIARVQRDSNDKPVQPVVIEKVTIERVPTQATEKPAEGGKKP